MRQRCPHVHGPGAVSVDKDHIWAFFDSSYTAVNLAAARVECNQDRKDKDRMWMGIVLDEQLVYKLGEGQKRSSFAELHTATPSSRCTRKIWVRSADGALVLRVT